MSRIATFGMNYAASMGTQGNNALGNNSIQPWTQLVASTPFDSDELIFFCASSHYSAWALFDLGVGAAGTEVPVIQGMQNINSNNYNNAVPQTIQKIPMSIPAGSRISFRTQVYNNNDVGSATVMLINTGGQPITRVGLVDNMGAVRTTSKGTTVTAGAANVKGAYTQIIGSTINEYKGLMFQIGQGSTSYGSYFFDIAIGAAGSEQIIVPDYLAASDNYSFSINLSPILPFKIPLGSRISVRCQCSDANATADVSLLGVA